MCTLAKFQIPVLTYKGHCISSIAMPTAIDATNSHVLHTGGMATCCHLKSLLTSPYSQHHHDEE